HQLDDGLATVRVTGGRDDAGRFVQQVVDEDGLDADRHPIDFDVVVIGVDAPAEHRNLAVDGDSPLGDQVFADTPAAPTADCQDLLQSFALRKRGVLG